jgi:hypothetical protein
MRWFAMVMFMAGCSGGTQPVAPDNSGRKMPSEAAISTFVNTGEPVKLRGSAMDYLPGEIPAGTYPAIGSDGMMIDAVTCPPNGTCSVHYENGKLTVTYPD